MSMMMSRSSSVDGLIEGFYELVNMSAVELEYWFRQKRGRSISHRRVTDREAIGLHSGRVLVTLLKTPKARGYTSADLLQMERTISSIRRLLERAPQPSGDEYARWVVELKNLGYDVQKR